MTETHRPPLIDIHDATVWRGDTRVFDGLTLRVMPGEHTVILGPNGAGKTTLLKLLTRELYPVRRKGSRVRIEGRERFDVWALRRRLGVVSHDLQHEYRERTSGLDVVLSGFRSSIGIAGIDHGLGRAEKERAREIMRALGVESLGGTPLGSMSTGQQRRCLLARALVHDPRVLVLDEPTAGLDLAAAFQYLGIVREQIRAGRTIVLVTHHVNEIPPEIERAVLLDRGRVVADGAKARVLTDENLSALYRTPVRVHRADGFFVALPGEAARRNSGCRPGSHG